MATYKDKYQYFVATVNQLNSNNSVPKWFKPYIGGITTFTKELILHLETLEKKLAESEAVVAVQKTVSDTLCNDRDRLLKSMQELEDALDEQEQYSRRTCLLLHGVKEERGEDVEKKVTEVLNGKLNALLEKKIYVEGTDLVKIIPTVSSDQL